MFLGKLHRYWAEKHKYRTSLCYEHWIFLPRPGSKQATVVSAPSSTECHLLQNHFTTICPHPNNDQSLINYSTGHNDPSLFPLSLLTRTNQCVQLLIQ